MTLTQTAVLVKQITLISVIALVLGIGSFVSYKVWYAYYLRSLPPIEEKPDTKFGQLSPIEFPATSVSSSNFTYSIETVTGNLPKIGIDAGFEKIVKVYFLTQTFATLLSSERSENLAEKFGITSPPEILSETKYQFTDGDKSLLVDLDTGNFSYTNEASISGSINLDDDNKLFSGFERTLANLGFLKEDLRQGRTKITLLKAEGTKFVPTKLRTEAVAGRISLWPAPVDEKPIFSGYYDQSLINGIVVGDAGNIENYLALDFTYYPIDNSTFATYPVKSPQQALEDLKNGTGIVTVEPSKPQAVITSVYLGYYLPQKYTPYLQPIYVFEGPQFAAYVAAINSESNNPAIEN